MDLVSQEYLSESHNGNQRKLFYSPLNSLAEVWKKNILTHLMHFVKNLKKKSYEMFGKCAEVIKVSWGVYIENVSGTSGGKHEIN